MSKVPKLGSGLLDKVDANPHPHGRMIGYARVSMADQSNNRQVADLIKAGCNPKDIFTDSASGRDMDRPGWRNLWRHLREGDTLVVLAIDRLGRNLVKVIQTVKTLEDRGVGLKVLSGLIDTTNPNGRLMLHIVAAMAQWERELIVERTKHGLKTAREQGRVGGAAKQVTDEQIEDARKQRSKGVSVAALAGKLGVSKTALYKRLNPPGKKEKAK